ncbi:MADS-box protein SOC1-like isoform X3 [Macadamia integrifolia]|uniref:MADS-box protein SOC1-like isoform X3 n=1 Tax=Macadamia integrifolia TaxID=60698 RepID=UPI001C4F6429|nr:MADS-box protein SOC1-like isoform X3 [Macadamia integrifolia]
MVRGKTQMKRIENATSSMQKIIDRYQRLARDVQTNNKAMEQNIQLLKYEYANMEKKIEILEVSKRRLMGEDLGACSIDELQQIERQLEQSLSNIRAKKTQLFKEHIEKLKEKERILKAENEILCEKVQAQQPTIQDREIVPYSQSNPHTDVETELFIGRPERGTDRSEN